MDYQARMKRIVDACGLVGADIDYDRLEKNLTKAEFLEQVKSVSQEEAANELRSLAVSRLSSDMPASPRARSKLCLLYTSPSPRDS